MAIPNQLKTRLLVAALPVSMVLLWVLAIARGNGQLDAMGNPVGGDFAMFYLAAQSASQGDWSQLYNEAEQQRRLVALFPGLPLDTYLPYRYPPLLAWTLSPLGWFSYRIAHSLFLTVSLLAYLAAWWALKKTFWKQPLTVPLAAEPLASVLMTGLILSPMWAQGLIDGQASCLWFAVAAFAWVAIAQERFALAGACLALAACKPNVMLLLGVVWIVRYPRMLLGVLPMGLVMLAVTLSVAGRECLMQYVELARRLATDSWSVETPYWKVQSLLSWTELVCGSAARRVNLLLGLSGAVTVGLWWRSRSARAASSSELKYVNAIALSSGLVINVLFNPYTPVYDLLLLSLGMFAWLAWASEQRMVAAWFAARDVQIAALCLWIGPIVSQSLSKQLECPQQLMPLLLVALGLVLHSRLTALRAQPFCRGSVDFGEIDLRRPISPKSAAPRQATGHHP